jgi:hypothetical protein
MTCPSCARENRDDAAFCDACGAALRTLCPSCGRALRSEARFCDRCGAQRVPDPSSSRTASRVTAKSLPPRAYTPKHLADKIYTSASNVDPDRRRIVTPVHHANLQHKQLGWLTSGGVNLRSRSGVRPHADSHPRSSRHHVALVGDRTRSAERLYWARRGAVARKIALAARTLDNVPLFIARTRGAKWVYWSGLRDVARKIAPTARSSAALTASVSVGVSVSVRSARTSRPRAV